MSASPVTGWTARIRRADRWFVAGVVNVGLVLAWFVVNLVRPTGPPAVIWLGVPVGGVIVVVSLVRAAQTPGLRPETRRFWQQAVVAAGLVIVGQLLQAIDVIRHPEDPGDHFTVGMQIFDGAAVLVVVHMLNRLPLGDETAGEKLRVIMDAGTVMLGTAVFMWHFEARPTLANGNPSALVVSMILTVLALTAVFGLMKVVLSGHVFIARPALQMLAVAIIAGALGPALRPYLVTVQPHLYPTALSIPAVFLFGTWAGALQRSGQAGVSQAPERRRRGISLMPYLAVGAVDALLIRVIVNGDRSDDLVLAVAAVLLTALVVSRQITAFIDNGRLLDELDHGATHDTLTGLPNRALFHQRLVASLAVPDHAVSVALIDLDDFKEVNDTLGHEVGDLLLVSVAARLTGWAAPGCTVARLGGDEFVVVLDGAGPADADRAAQTMIHALRRPVRAGDHELPIRASIGIAHGRTGDDVSRLLRQADIAMYAAKRVDGTSFLHHAADMDANLRDRADLGAQLRDALTDDQLFLVYQPIVALDDGRLTGVETLVRWAHPVHGVLGPDSFMPVAERSGLVVPLGRRVLDRALGQMAAWIGTHAAAAPAVININISAREIREPTFADKVADLLARHGVAPERVVLEITETVRIEVNESIATLRQLRALGVRISLDDFGTGQSSLTTLHDCPVDQIKLDLSFTQAEPDGRPTVAAAVVELAAALGLDTVAEGIETGEQAHRLLSLGYTVGQGFLFSPPLAPDELSLWLTAPARSPSTVG